MSPFASWELYPFEEVLACNIKDVVGDIRLADADILLSYVARQLHGNMNDIVASSTELFFKDKTLTYARSSDVDSDWDTSPSVVLDMQFVHGPVSLWFKLYLGDKDIGVQISKLDLSDCISRSDFGVTQFASVLRSARLRPLPAIGNPSRIRLSRFTQH